jgi:hypothetical protein
MRSNQIKSAFCSVGIIICILMLGGFQEDPGAYLVEIVVHDRTNPECIQVMEIWSDKTTVVRDLAVGERSDHKCGPSGHCTNNTLNCRVLPVPAGGATCNYCTSGTANNKFCWPVNGIVCSTLQGEDYTCGTRMESTCVVGGPGGVHPTCNGLATPINLGTCTIEGCA